MTSFIENKVRQWNTPEVRETNLHLEYLEKKLFKTYEPCLSPNPNFWTRIQGWIENANGNAVEEQKLFHSIKHIFYVGNLEFNELYRRAYSGPIARWLIDQEGISFTDENATNKLLSAVEKTWFCPITDSMIINRFYHINNIQAPGADLRTDWRSLLALGDEERIRKYITDNNINYLVLLEDFVGGGSQMSDAVKFANRFSDIVSLLVIPLIICPKGIITCERLSTHTNVNFEPVLTLSKETFISEQVQAEENIYITELRDLSYSTYSQVSDNIELNAVNTDGIPIKPYHPLGWDNTGGLVVMFSNTPDNTLPMFHFKSENWNPIFPRHSRN